MSSRIIISDLVNCSSLSTETVKENDNFLQTLSKESEMSEELKDAMRTDDFSALLAKKRAEKESPQGGAESITAAVMKKYVSLKFGVIGSGQAGGRIAEVFYKYGYDACVINTARQDLEFLDIPEDNKLFIGDEHLGGAGRDLEFGLAAAERNEDVIRAFFAKFLSNDDMLILAVSGGGGTGSGTAEFLIRMMAEIGKPIIVIYALPGSFDDSQSKFNAIQTLAKMADLASKQVINSLILVDNAKIELAYPNLSQAAFWKTANQAVVDPLHMFNSVSAMPTNYEALDSMDFAKSLIESGNCVVFGSNKIPKEQYESDEMSLVTAIMDNLDQGLLAAGFNLKESQTVGILVTAKQSVLENVAYSSIAYVFKYISEEFESARSFKGIYAIPSDSDDITVHFIFSGLGLPKERVDSLKSEAKNHMGNLETKKKSTSMQIDLGKDKTTTQADRLLDRVKKKSSAMGKLINKTPGPLIRKR